MSSDLNTRPEANSLWITGSGSCGLKGLRDNIRLDGVEFPPVSFSRKASVSRVSWLEFGHDLAINYLAGPTKHRYGIPVAQLAYQFLPPVAFRI